jgi:hypothetical protein
MEPWTLVEGITVIVTELDKGLESSKGAVGATVTTISTLLLLISLPQAFILMKLFQTVDYYIYINCEYPTNFSKFLEILSANPLDLVPNAFEALSDDDGMPIYPRFHQFGIEIHVLANLGRHFTIIITLGAIKGLLRLLKFVTRKTRVARRTSSRVN